MYNTVLTNKRLTGQGNPHRLGPDYSQQGHRDRVEIKDGTKLVAFGLALRFFWDGKTDSLTQGWAEVTRLAREQHPKDANTMCGLLYVSHERGQGHVARLLAGCKEIAKKAKLTYFVAPLQLQTQWEGDWDVHGDYNTMALAEEDGLPKDWWLRCQVKLGAKILKPSQRSHRFVLSVAEATKQTKTKLKDGLQITNYARQPHRTYVNLEEDLVYFERGCVWIQHFFGGPE